MKNIFRKIRNLTSVLSVPDVPEESALSETDNKPEDSGNIEVSGYVISDFAKISKDGFSSGVEETDCSELETKENGQTNPSTVPGICPTFAGTPETANMSAEEASSPDGPVAELSPAEASPSQVIIIGTAHVSEKSVDQVKDAIRKYSPDVVAVELCNRRYKGLTEPEPEDKEMSVKDIISGGQIYYHLLYMLLAHLQKKMGDQMGVPPGSEMVAAIEGAQESGAGIALIDRDIQVTFRRFIAKMSLWEKIKFFFTLLGGSFGSDDDDDEMSIDNLTDQDVITALIDEFRKIAPTVANVLIDERDAYLAANILKTIQKAGPGKKIVVVIGAGHRKGVMNYLNNPSTIPDPATLVVVPEKKFGIGKVIGLLLIVLVFLLFGYILYSIATQPGLTLETFFLAFGAWFFINGALSAIGAAVARGHYTSIVTAFCIAWLTSLNPFLAAGWFAGLAEARVRKPTKKDFSAAVSAETFSDLTTNNFFRVLAVAALANIGSMIGTFIGAYVVLKISGLDMEVLLNDIIRSVI